MIKHPHVPRKKFNCYTYFEAETGDGQLISISCTTEDIQKIKNILPLIKKIDIPQTKKVTLSHGGYCTYSRYDIIQHRYAGGMHGYIEALEIKDPPDGRCGFIIFSYTHENYFVEFENKNSMLTAWSKSFSLIGNENEIKKIKGFKRYVYCGGLNPWFYAVGDEHLMGDFIFPDVFGEHPVYKPMKKFIVRDYDGHPTIKTCMGAISWEEEQYTYFGHKNNKVEKLEVYWDDGTVYRNDSSPLPEPLKTESLWIDEAVNKFKQLLSGKFSYFEIPFLNGTKFIGKLHLCEKSKPGNYNIKLRAKKDNKIKEISGKIRFKPTKDYPSIKLRIKHDGETIGLTDIEILSCVLEKANYSYRGPWEGVY